MITTLQKKTSSRADLRPALSSLTAPTCPSCPTDHIGSKQFLASLEEGKGSCDVQRKGKGVRVAEGEADAIC